MLSISPATVVWGGTRCAWPLTQSSITFNNASKPSMISARFYHSRVHALSAAGPVKRFPRRV